MIDPNTVLKVLADATERRNDVLENIQATKGLAYSLHLKAVADTGNLYRTTNSLVCEKVPPEIVEIVAQMQSSAINALIEPFFFQEFPGIDDASIKKRHAACDEFVTNLEALFKQRRDAEQQLGGGAINF